MNDSPVTQLLERLQKQLQAINERLSAVEQRMGMPLQAVSKSEPTPTRKTENAPLARQPQAPSFDWQKIESFIGTYALQVIGIIVFLFGMGFLLKYSIEMGWLSPVVRVALGLGAATLLLAASHYTRKQYHLWSIAGSAGASILYYLTVYAAYDYYQLISLNNALLGFVCNTALTMYCAIIYDSIGFAVFSLIGGFLTPWLLDLPKYNLTGLAAYLVVLALGFTIVAIKKNWQSLLLITHLFLASYYVIYLTGLDVLATPYFIGALYIILIAIPCLVALRKRDTSDWLAPASVLAAHGWLLYPFYRHIINPLMTNSGSLVSSVDPLALSAGLFGLGALLYLSIIYKKNKLNTPMLAALFIAAVYCFVTAIFMFWSGYDRIIALQLFGLAIVAISWYIKQPFMRIATYAIWLYAFLDFMLSVLPNRDRPDNVLFNYITLTIAILCAAYGIAHALLRREKTVIHEYEKNIVPKTLEVAIAFLVYVLGRVHIALRFDTVAPSLQYAATFGYTNLTNVLLTIYSCLYALLMIGIGLYKRANWIRYFGFGLIFVTLSMLASLIVTMSNTLHRIIAFLLVGILLTVASFGYQRMSKKLIG